MIRLEIIGNLGRDAEIKTANGREYIRFTVASSEKKTINGQVLDSTTWVTCFASATRFSNRLGYLKLGKQVFVRGNVTVDTYVDKNNQTVAGLTCNVDDLYFCGGNTSNSPSMQQAAAQQQSTGASFSQPTTFNQVMTNNAPEVAPPFSSSMPNFN